MLKVFILRLDELLLSDKMIDKFLKALSSVTMPVNILKYYVQKLRVTCKNNSPTDFKTLQDTILAEVYFERPDSKNVNNLHGNVFKQIAEYEKEIKALGKSMLMFNCSQYLLLFKSHSR